jgi:hypothetical protein
MQTYSLSVRFGLCSLSAFVHSPAVAVCCGCELGRAANSSKDGRTEDEMHGGQSMCSVAHAPYIILHAVASMCTCSFTVMPHCRLRRSGRASVAPPLRHSPRDERHSTPMPIAHTIAVRIIHPRCLLALLAELYLK